ncbi:hypothetical protein GQ43DRAFT_338360, partial [Delitschia confertaspora ATCC 74209]
IPISSNPYTILRRLRRLDYPILVWADALAISQTDVSGRTHQVGLMGKRCRKRNESVIWFGEGTKEDYLEPSCLSKQTISDEDWNA